MIGRPARAAGWFAFLGAALVVLRLAATGDLAGPPLTSLDALEAWVDVRGPIPTAVALVRLLAEAGAWYLLAVSVLHLAGGALRLRPMRLVADALSVPAARRVVHGALGLSLVTSGVADARTPAPAPPTQPVPDLHLDVDTSTHTRTGQPVPAGTATMRPLEDRPATGGTARMTPVTETRTWTVHPGESFWTIASDVLHDTWGRPPSDRELDPFWRALVDLNRGRLVDPDDPDLIVPGQVFELPPVPHQR